MTRDDVLEGETVRYRLVDPPPRHRTLQRASPYVGALFVAFSDSTLRLAEPDSASERELALARIRELQVVRGVHRSTLLGGLVGSGAGCGVGAALVDEDPGGLKVLSCFGGALVGLLVGAEVGRTIKSPRWLSVDLTGADPSGSAGLGLRLAIAVGQ